MLKILRNLPRDNSGATAVEYGLIVAMIVIAMIVSLQGVANQNTTMWTMITAKSKTAIEAAQP